MIKFLVIIAMFGIVISLGSGLMFMIKDQGRSNRVVKALTWRIALSVVLFSFVALSVYEGWVVPGSIIRSQHQDK